MGGILGIDFGNRLSGNKVVYRGFCLFNKCFLVIVFDYFMDFLFSVIWYLMIRGCF